MRPKFKWLEKLFKRLMPIPEPEQLEWQEIDVAQVETEHGFVPIKDLPFNRQALGLASNRKATGSRAAVRRRAAENPNSKASTREHLLQGSESSERTYCKQCLADGKTSQTFVGTVYGTMIAFEPYYDARRLYHSHDPNVQRLTYHCSRGHSWEKRRWPKCWCGYTARPEGATNE